MRPLSIGGLACAEFWFNRYQTLLGGFIALLAAGLAWVGIKKQLFAVGQQIKIADRQNAIAIIPILNERIQYGEKIRQNCFQIFDQLGDLRRYDKWLIGNIKDAYNAIDNDLDLEFAVAPAKIHYERMSQVWVDLSKTLVVTREELLRALADRDLNSCFDQIVSQGSRIRDDFELRFREYGRVFAGTSNYKYALSHRKNKLKPIIDKQIDFDDEYFLKKLAEINERTDAFLDVRDVSYQQAAAPVGE